MKLRCVNQNTFVGELLPMYTSQRHIDVWGRTDRHDQTLLVIRSNYNFLNPIHSMLIIECNAGKHVVVQHKPLTG